MIKNIGTFILLLAAMVPMLSHAGPATDSLGQCLADNTTGKDRKDLAKWLFVGMAAHPEIKSFAPVSAAATESAQRTMGALVNRLIGTACAKEMKNAVVTDGEAGARTAFELLGKIAMGELMANPQVSSTIGGFEPFTDKKKLEEVMSRK